MLSGYEGLGQVTALLEPQGVDDPHPDVGQCPYGPMTLAFLPFAAVIGRCPRFLEGRLPGKLIQGIPERFDTGVAPVCMGIVATCLRHG
jgi:hypothetical protein